MLLIVDDIDTSMINYKILRLNLVNAELTYYSLVYCSAILNLERPVRGRIQLLICRIKSWTVLTAFERARAK
jgi:hypothetical protein